MIATQDKTIFRAAKNRFHPAPVSLDSRCARVVEVSAVNRAPEVCVQFKIGAPPLAFHRAKELLEVPLHLRVRAVKHIPWATPPTAKRHAIRAQRFAVAVFHKPVRMLLKYVRL